MPSAQWKLPEREVHTQCARRDNSMHPVEAPWEHHESAGNRQLERRRYAKVAVRSPWDRRENTVTSPSSEKNQTIMEAHGALWNLRTPCSRSGNAARRDRGLI